MVMATNRKDKFLASAEIFAEENDYLSDGREVGDLLADIDEGDAKIDALCAAVCSEEIAERHRETWSGLRARKMSTIARILWEHDIDPWDEDYV